MIDAADELEWDELIQEIDSEILYDIYLEQYPGAGHELVRDFVAGKFPRNHDIASNLDRRAGVKWNK